MDATIIVLVVFGLAFSPLIMLFLDGITGKHFTCHKLKWHNGNTSIKSYIDNSIFHRCTKCEKVVHKDDKGNWVEGL